jgi:hypothetical protein
VSSLNASPVTTCSPLLIMHRPQHHLNHMQSPSSSGSHMARQSFKYLLK